MTETIADQLRQLKLELESYESKIAELTGQRDRLQRIPVPGGSDPNAIAQGLIDAAHETHRRAADIAGHNNALQVLNEHRSRLLNQIEQLQVEQARQELLARVEEGRQAIAAKGAELEELGEQILEKLWELKALWKQYNPQFKQARRSSEDILVFLSTAILKCHPTKYGGFAIGGVEPEELFEEERIERNTAKLGYLHIK